MADGDGTLFSLHQHISGTAVDKLRTGNKGTPLSACQQRAEERFELEDTSVTLTQVPVHNKDLDEAEES
ncbi:hypothetical protein ACOMHN_019071 [Nucella lapillus]